MCSVILFAANPTSDRSLISGNSIAAVAFIHAALFVFPTVAFALPNPSKLDIGIMIVAGFSLRYNTWIALLSVILQYFAQYFEMKRMLNNPGALSLLSITLQAVILPAVAVRLFLRTGPLPQELRAAPTEEFRRAPLLVRWSIWLEGQWACYKWRALPINYILHGVGCAVLLSAYLITGRGHGVLGVESEEAPLLA